LPLWPFQVPDTNPAQSFRAVFQGIGLERIMFSRHHFVVSVIYVNPLTIIWLDQIHRHDGSLVAIPSEPDLI
jgi:hypothetical protein